MATNLQKRKPKGSGSIRRQPNGMYLGRIRVAGSESFSCTGKTEKEVQKKLNEFKISALREEIIPRKQTVASYIESWLTSVKQPSMKPASYDRLERTFLKQIKNTPVGRSQFGTLTTREIQLLINSYTQTLSYSTIKKVYDLLNSCYNYALAVRDISYNPASGVLLPKRENLTVQTKEVLVMNDSDLATLENAINITFSNGKPKYRYAAAYILIANTGLRSGEALALTWNHVDFNAKTITVIQNASRVKRRDTNTVSGSQQIITTTKSKSGSRQIPLNFKALRALEYLKSQQEAEKLHTNYVIATSTGKMVVQNSFYRIFQTMQLSLGIQPVTVHALRHTFATNLIRRNVDIKVVSQLLGHSSVKITYDIYVHSDLSRAIQAVKNLD